MSDEESVDLTPGIVWADSQLIVIRDLAARVHHAEATIRRVRELHRPIDHEGYPAAETDELSYCAYDGFVWPCVGHRVLDGYQP